MGKPFQLFGDSTVGKSAITQVFHSDGTHFPKNYTVTTAVELVTKSIVVPESHDSVEFYIYDSAGKELFYEEVQKYWECPNMVLLVYDITNETSFNSCAKWLQRVRSKAPEMQISGVLVGNKTDLDERRVVSPDTGRQFAENNGLEYFECSAKEMQNVDPIFVKLAQMHRAKYQESVELFKNVT